MSRPICCGKAARPYRKEYGRGGWEEGWRCKRCGRARIPDGTFDLTAWKLIEAEMDKIREAAILEENTRLTNAESVINL